MVTVYDTNVLTRIDVATKQNFNEKVVSEEKVILLIASINLINYERGRPGPVSLWDLAHKVQDLAQGVSRESVLAVLIFSEKRHCRARH